MASSFINAIPMTVFNSANLIATYLAVNPDGTPEPCGIIRIINASNANVIISYDGVGDHDIVLASSSLQLDFETNSLPPAYIALLKDGAVIYVRSAAPGVGNIYFAGYFQPGH